MLQVTRDDFIQKAMPMLVDLEVPGIDDKDLDVQEQGADGDRYGCGTILIVTGIAETTQSAMATGKMKRVKLRAESKAAMYATILYLANCIGEAQLARDAGDTVSPPKDLEDMFLNPELPDAE